MDEPNLEKLIDECSLRWKVVLDKAKLIDQYRPLHQRGLRPPAPNDTRLFGETYWHTLPQYPFQPTHVDLTWMSGCKECSDPAQFPEYIPLGSGTDCAIEAVAIVGYYTNVFVAAGDNMPLDRQREDYLMTAHEMRILNSFPWSEKKAGDVDQSFVRLCGRVREYLKGKNQTYEGNLAFSTVLEPTLAASRLFAFTTTTAYRCPECRRLEPRPQSNGPQLIQRYEVGYEDDHLNRNATVRECVEEYFRPFHRNTPTPPPRCGNPDCQRVLQKIRTIADRLPAFLLVTPTTSDHAVWDEKWRKHLAHVGASAFQTSFPVRYYTFTEPGRQQTVRYRFAGLFLHLSQIHFVVGLVDSLNDRVTWFDTAQPRQRRTTGLGELSEHLARKAGRRLSALVYRQTEEV